MKQFTTLLATLLATSALAGETRQLDAHEHGVGALNIAIDGNTVAMELRAPGADIVGFEYAAVRSEDLSTIESAVAMLSRPLELFVLPASAECAVVEANAELEVDDEHTHGEDHAAADHGHDHDHAHDKHADASHAADEGHSEFHAEYLLTCAEPGAISAIDFAYFKAFENAQKLDIQIVSASGSQAFVVERDSPKLELPGMF